MYGLRACPALMTSPTPNAWPALIPLPAPVPWTAPIAWRAPAGMARADDMACAGRLACAGKHGLRRSHGRRRSHGLRHIPCPCRFGVLATRYGQANPWTQARRRNSRVAQNRQGAKVNCGGTFGHHTSNLIARAVCLSRRARSRSTFAQAQPRQRTRRHRGTPPEHRPPRAQNAAGPHKLPERSHPIRRDTPRSSRDQQPVAPRSPGRAARAPRRKSTEPRSPCARPTKRRQPCAR